MKLSLLEAPCKAHGAKPGKSPSRNPKRGPSRCGTIGAFHPHSRLQTHRRACLPVLRQCEGAGLVVLVQQTSGARHLRAFLELGARYNLVAVCSPAKILTFSGLVGKPTSWQNVIKSKDPSKMHQRQVVALLLVSL